MPDPTKLIVGITTEGKKFRPSDWCKRLAGTAASFGANKRMQYHKYVHPCFVDEHSASGLCIDDRLEEEAPGMYKHLMDFAKSNNLIIISGRRSELRGKMSD